MIIDSIIFIGINFFSAVISLFPIIDTPTLEKITNTSAAFRTQIASAGWLFPIDLLFQIMGMIIAIEFSVLLYKTIRWIGSILTLGIIK